MKGRLVEDIVYDQLYPKPKANDPQNFQAFLQRNLVPEVRQETHAFYGHLDTQEAKYPGLDYTHQTHQIRLSRWPWHRRLFRAFDAMRLTDAEICSLTKWEGTKWAKEKFEKEQGVIIRDTTADEVSDWVPPTDIQPALSRLARMNQTDRERERSLIRSLRNLGERMVRDDEEGSNQDESDDEFESVGVDLNERLRDRATQREAGDTSVVLDEEWEQWLKNAIDSGELTLLTEQMTEQMFRRASSTSVIPAALIPPGMLSAARSGQWSEIPEVLHPMLLRTLEAESPSPRIESRRRLTGADSTTRSALPRVTRPTIRLPSAQDAF
ncbi:hypothetical protein QQS21_010973 [Conoideocrella luteorostrata]|uniref:Uncharacterized protein n=1 Tax=Conoideocrella luteorostrata TaxID=1105319 RepID=A0AAJ0CGB8_9HYPO|nr:hypothetical protein QQS21_010973 [Conoideocrella luteorostrata]